MNVSLSKFVALRRDDIQSIFLEGRDMLDKFFNGDHKSNEVPYGKRRGSLSMYPELHLKAF